MKERLTKILQMIFAYSMGILMIVAFLIAVCYIVAFIIGRPGSEAICSFLDTYILSYVYIMAIATCIIGVINMYLRGSHVFILDLSLHKDEK